MDRPVRQDKSEVRISLWKSNFKSKVIKWNVGWDYLHMIALQSICNWIHWITFLYYIKSFHKKVQPGRSASTSTHFLQPYFQQWPCLTLGKVSKCDQQCTHPCSNLFTASSSSISVEYMLLNPVWRSSLRSIILWLNYKFNNPPTTKHLINKAKWKSRHWQ